MSIPLFQVDAFTDTPYAGNPAAVCLLDAPAPDGWMGDVAAEMNLSETAFTWPEGDARGVIVTSRGAKYDFVSRCFFPKVGVDEDPVTGSAHCALAPYWAERLGRAEMTGYQASARGGVVRVRLAGDRVFLGGRAVTVVEGNLVVAPDPTGSG